MCKVSVITPCYNAERFIQRTVDSVKHQSFSDWEHVIVDDGSSDRSVDMIQACKVADSRVRLICQSNGGVCKARNAGVAQCASASKYLLFLDADDCLEPQMLQSLVDYLELRPDVGMVYCACRLIDEQDHFMDQRIRDGMWQPRLVPSRFWVQRLQDDVPETPFVAIFALHAIPPCACVIRRCVYEKTGGWDEAFGQIHEDTDLFLRLALRSQIHFLPRELVRHRRHSGQSTGDITKIVSQERKLFEKWLSLPDISATDKASVQSAWRFREGRLIPYQGLRAARRQLFQGHLPEAFRFIAGAAKRYVRYGL